MNSAIEEQKQATPICRDLTGMGDATVTDTRTTLINRLTSHRRRVSLTRDSQFT